jgi:hypothetical protein
MRRTGPGLLRYLSVKYRKGIIPPRALNTGCLDALNTTPEKIPRVFFKSSDCFIV